MTDIVGMLYEATFFNQPLNDWNVSKVEIMEGMFADAHSFNQPLNNLDVSNVTSMYRMWGKIKVN